MRGRIREYDADRITISYDLGRCIHAHECVRGLPRVFDVERRVWVDATQAGPEAIAEVVARCPTGALHFRRKDGGLVEAVPEQNQAQVLRDGPVYLRGDLQIHTQAGVIHDTRAALCRCGASRNKPFCDNSHDGAGFRDIGSVSPASRSVGPSSGPLRVLPQGNGPCLIEGAFTVSSGDGTTVVTCGPATSLCRCGHSANKPFCDGSHSVAGFAAE